MSEVTPDQIRNRLAIINERKAEYERKSNIPPGRLKRHEVWRHAYLSFPYLIGAPDERVHERFCDVFMNTMDLNLDAKIIPRDFQNEEWGQKFTHLLEEYDSRGGAPTNTIAAARAPFLRYFSNGDPVATRMFNGYVAPTSPFLVKYGKREFLEPMLHKGEIRICPASYYNDSAHIASVKDDELSRTFFIPTFRERLSGQDTLDFDGHQIAFGNDDIVLPVICNNYFLFSLCDQIYYRLPTDFNADAALVIRKPDLFTQRVISHFLAAYPEFEPLSGPVTYYDPYRDYTKMKIHEMSKHFGYSYQREVRIVFRPRRPIRHPLEPVFLKIGPISDFADLNFV